MGSDDGTLRWTRAFVLAAMVWAVGMAGGYAIVQSTRHLPSDVPAPAATGDVLHARTDNAGQDHGLRSADSTKSKPALFAFIFGRNVSVYVWLLAGLLSAGTVTFALLLGNGLILGHTIGLALATGMSPDALWTLLLPHGVLEIGTFCIAGAVGFQGFNLVSRPGRTDWSAIKALRLGLVLAYGVAALAVAAALETYLTGAFAAALGRP